MKGRLQTGQTLLGSRAFALSVIRAARARFLLSGILESVALAAQGALQALDGGLRTRQVGVHARGGLEGSQGEMRLSLPNGDLAKPAKRPTP